MKVVRHSKRGNYLSLQKQRSSRYAAHGGSLQEAYIIVTERGNKVLLKNASIAPYHPVEIDLQP